jgi:hypothetical protein
MYTQTLNWNKCEGDAWCPFLTVNLQHPHFQNLEGVYIIWHGGPNPATVYVGQGNIAERLRCHRTEPNILQYSSLGLFVTWASVSAPSRDGIERYLADTLKPKEGVLHPYSAPIGVNLPW